MTERHRIGQSDRHFTRTVGAFSVLASLAGCVAREAIGDPPAADQPAPGDDGTEPTDTGTPVYEQGDPGSGGETVEFLEYEIELAERRLVELQGYRGWFPGGYDDAVRSLAEDIGRTARRSVVLLETGSGHATGWFVEPNLLLTNSHNVTDPTTGTVRNDRLSGRTIDGDAFDVEVVGHVPSAHPDVALLRASVNGPPLSLGSTADLEPGTPLLHIGHPGSVGNWVVSLGRYLYSNTTAVDATNGGSDRFIETEALVSSVPGRQGNSGSPVLTLEGMVVGMTYGGEDRTPLTSRDDVKPTHSFVFDWPIAAEMWSNHVTIETAMELATEWM